MDNSNNVEITYSHIISFLQRVGYAINRFYVWLGLKKEKMFWGLVYDAKTKEPLDPVILKLVSTDVGTELQTCITDMKGGYGFLANPGRYKILAMRTNYAFPSKLVKGDIDGQFRNIYHGEFFEIRGGSEVVAPNIPMDPVSEDWNQIAKRKMFNSFWRKILSVTSFLALLLFWLGLFAVSGFVYWQIKSSGNVVFTPAVYGFIAYVVVIVLSIFVPTGRLWGRVLDARSKTPLTNIKIELVNPVIKDSVMAKTLVWNDGKFFLRANPGKYNLIFKGSDDSGQMVEIGRVVVKIGAKSLINQTFYIKY